MTVPMKPALCDALAFIGAGIFAFGLHLVYAPAAWLFVGGFLYWAAFVLRGKKL